MIVRVKKLRDFLSQFPDNAIVHFDLVKGKQPDFDVDDVLEFYGDTEITYGKWTDDRGRTTQVDIQLYDKDVPKANDVSEYIEKVKEACKPLGAYPAEIESILEDAYKGGYELGRMEQGVFQ